MADHMRTELVTDALQMALAHRRPAPGLIWHSDQGSQFVSLAFGQQARAAGIAQSMGSRGDCFDNAVAESFFATLKKELIHRRAWPTKAELRTEVFDYIEVFYNRRRRHSHARDALARAVRDDHPPASSRRTASRLTTPCPPKRGHVRCARCAGSGRVADTHLVARLVVPRAACGSDCAYNLALGRERSPAARATDLVAYVSMGA